MTARRYGRGSLATCPHPWGTAERCCGQPVTSAATVSFQPLYLDTMQALEDLLTSLLQRDLTPQGLQVMVEVCSGVVPWGLGSFVFPGPSCHRGATGAVRCLLSASVGGM